MVYPGDLVAWAREHPHLSTPADEELGSRRTLAGQSCPRSGFWFTPAKASRRRHFNAGEVMPDAGGDYGVTIWQWDEHQN
jgi:hypothetical protein